MQFSVPSSVVECQTTVASLRHDAPRYTRIPRIAEFVLEDFKAAVEVIAHRHQFFSSRSSSVSNAAAASTSTMMTGSKTRKSTAKARPCPVARTAERAPLVIERSFPQLVSSFGMCVWDLCFSDRGGVHRTPTNSYRTSGESLHPIIRLIDCPARHQAFCDASHGFWCDFSSAGAVTRRTVAYPQGTPRGDLRDRARRARRLCLASHEGGFLAGLLRQCWVP